MAIVTGVIGILVYQNKFQESLIAQSEYVVSDEGDEEGLTGEPLGERDSTDMNTVEAQPGPGPSSDHENTGEEPE